jgi:MraZ protein
MDDRGRVPLPVAFRAALGNEPNVRLVAKKDEYLPCLAVMTEKEWERRIAEIDSQLNPYDRTDQILRDALHRNKAALEPDNIGRILIPKKLCEKANISKEIIFVGAGSEVKLWAKDNYDKNDINEETLAELLQKRLGNK